MGLRSYDRESGKCQRCIAISNTTEERCKNDAYWGELCPPHRMAKSVNGSIETI